MPVPSRVAGLCASALFALLTLGGVAFGAESIHASPHLEHTSWLLGAKLVHFNAWNPGHGDEPNETAGGFGGGVMVERTVIEGWLEVELSVAAVSTDEGTAVPIDVLFKKSFELGRFNPYVGVGPSISIDIADGEAHAAAGGAIAAGTYVWFSDHVGLDVDIDYALVSNHGVAQELAFSLGPVIRF